MSFHTSGVGLGALDWSKLPASAGAQAAGYTQQWGQPVCTGQYWFWPSAPDSEWHNYLTTVDAASSWAVYQGVDLGSLWPTDLINTPPHVADLGCRASVSSGASTSTSTSTSTSASTTYPWKAYSSNTLALQNSLNKKLASMGKPRITADGKLGPTTCAALKYAGMDTSMCQSFGTYPPSGGSTGPVVTTSDVVVPTQGQDWSWGRIAVAGLLVAGLGAWAYFRK